jgi:DNA-3-methyladenine glycosylase II
MRLAFVVDGLREHAGVLLTQLPDGAVTAEIQTNAPIPAVRRQVERILSLDHDGDEWAALGVRDPVLGGLQRQCPGQRPVLFHNAYESCAWCVLSARWSRPQAAAVRRRISEELGPTYELGGESLPAFPTPERLLELGPMKGLADEKVTRLQGVAQAALEGRLDTDRLRALPFEEAAAEIQKLRGMGPFYTGLVVNRALGHADALPSREPRIRTYAAHYYGLEGPLSPEGLSELAEGWRPFRTWAVVLLRIAGDRAQLPWDGPRL